jgi:CheY-like chemotaxis protein
MSTERILVIDDEDAARGLLQAVLEHFSYRVLPARSGSEGLGLFARQSEDVDLIILDLTMPGMSGAQALPKLRAIRPEVPIIVSSGYDQTEALRQCGESTVDGFLQKPFSLTQLSETVRAVLHHEPTKV